MPPVQGTQSPGLRHHPGLPQPSGRSARTYADSDRLALRRAVALGVMTILVPGSAQLMMGNRRVGRAAMRTWLVCWLTALALVGLAIVWQNAFFVLVTSPKLLVLGRLILIGLAIGWVALLVDAWRLSRPMQMSRKYRAAMSGINAALCFASAGSLLFAAHLVGVPSSLISTVFASTTVVEPHDGRYNILLMGTDSGDDRFGMRPDSMTVASIDASTGRAVLIGLPRNLEDVPFPRDSFMHQEFPDGFDCDGCYINSVNTWANDHAAELGVAPPEGGGAAEPTKGQRTPGISATMAAIEQVTGLKLSYYVLINMQGFSDLIDAVGGVDIDVRERTPIGGIDDPIEGWIETGPQRLNGFQALWYARSRKLNNDFSRMGRQKCLMHAMAAEMSPSTVLLKARAIADSSATLLDTDIPASDLNVFMELALRTRTQPISSVSLTPPQVDTSDPDFGAIRRMVADGVRDSERSGDDSTPAPTLVRASLPTVAPPAQAATAVERDPVKANSAADLADAC